MHGVENAKSQGYGRPFPESSAYTPPNNQEADAPYSPSLSNELRVQSERITLLHETIDKLGAVLQGLRGPSKSVPSCASTGEPKRIEPVLSPAVESLKQNSNGISGATDRLFLLLTELQV
jgi:hypothetical protein